MAELWGAINGMQLAAYLPIVNIKLPDTAGSFSSAIAGIVTFDIPNVDMEFIFAQTISFPEDDSIMNDIRLDVISDETEINGVSWTDLKGYFWSDPYFDKKAFADSLNVKDK